MLIDLALLILTVRLFHSFIQYGKKDFLNDFVLEGKGRIMEVEADLRRYRFEKESPNMNKGSLVVNDFLFYKKINLLCQRHLAKDCKPNSS